MAARVEVSVRLNPDGSCACTFLLRREQVEAIIEGVVDRDVTIGEHLAGVIERGIKVPRTLAGFNTAVQRCLDSAYPLVVPEEHCG